MISQSLLVAQTEYLLREGRQLQVDALAKGAEQFLFGCLFSGSHFYHNSLLHLLFFLPVHQQIDTAVVSQRQQVGMQRVCPQVGLTMEQLGKYIAHHILALCFIAK